MRLLLLFGLWMTLAAAAAPAAVESVQVKTRAPENRVVTMYFRVPANYNLKQAGLWPVLVLFSWRNSDGRADASGRLGWGEWAKSSDALTTWEIKANPASKSKIPWSFRKAYPNADAMVLTPENYDSFLLSEQNPRAQ